MLTNILTSLRRFLEIVLGEIRSEHVSLTLSQRTKNNRFQVWIFINTYLLQIFCWRCAPRQAAMINRHSCHYKQVCPTFRFSPEQNWLPRGKSCIKGGYTESDKLNAFSFETLVVFFSQFSTKGEATPFIATLFNWQG